MTTIAQSPRRRLIGALPSLACAALLFWQARQMQAVDQRLATDPHVTGRIERTWTKSGKRGGRFADVAFVVAAEGGPVTCRVANLRIGVRSLQVESGQGIDLAPLPGSCARPDVPGDAPSNMSIILFYGFGLLTGVFGLMWLTRFPAPPLRLSR